VSRNRLLKYINFLIGAAVLGSAGLGYWFLYRPLPRISGRLEAPVQFPAQIERDARGVPHITAGSTEDALFLQGFATAQDRLFQMDVTRRRAAGELAEIIGPRALASDQQARRLLPRQIARTQLRSMNPEQRKAFAAYARGVNFYLERNRGRLPVDFALLGYDPRPWSVADSILVWLQMLRTFSKSWDREILKQSYLSEGDPEKVEALFPVRSGLEAYPGSNAWAVSGAWTGTGKPLLANDSHLEFSVPCFWHQVHLKTPGLDVAGMSIPGLPGVVIGHNQWIAWGAVKLGFDVQDLYQERLDPRTGRYLYRGKLEQARLEREVIRVKGQQPVELGVWVTRHGPVVFSRGDLHLALRWSATEAGEFPYPFLALDRVRNWEQFRAALKLLPAPPQNFLYADIDGNIGIQAAGRLPIRRSWDGGLPVDGASGNFEWDGFIPFEELPSVFNPSGGILICANQNPFPEGYPYRVNGNFAPGYRFRRIRELLTARKDWSAGEFLKIQTDIYDPFLHFLARQLVAAYDARGMRTPRLEQAVELLRNWDGRMEEAAAAPLVAQLLFQHLRTAVAEAAAPNAGLSYAAAMAPAVIERLLRRRPRTWFRDYNQLLLGSFTEAVEEGRRMQGDAVRHWSYGRFTHVRLSAGIIERVPLLGRYFRLGRISLGGSARTVQQRSRRLGPVMRMVLDLSDWDRSLANLTLGESGQPLSAHFRDQWDSYRKGTSFPMEYQRVRVEHRLHVQPER